MPVFEHVTIDALPQVAQQVLSAAGSVRVFMFHGDMGAGKTTFIKVLCEALHVTSEVSSPTYGIINEYITQDKTIVYHIDCYRLNSVEEAVDAGVDECIDSGHYCFIEWADMIEPLWPEKYVKIDMQTIGETRNIMVSC